MDTRQLEGVGLFSSLSKKELERLSQWTDLVDVPAGHTLVAEGALAYEFCVIDDGSAVVERDGEQIAELGPGDFFGEIGLLETGRRTATVRATTPLRVIVMVQRDFRTMQREMPAVADRITAAIRARLDHDAESASSP